MKMEAIGGAHLPIGQAGILFSVSKEKFNVEAGFVIVRAIDFPRIQGWISGKQQDGLTGLVRLGVDQGHDPERALEADMIEARRIQVDAVVLTDFIEAPQIRPIDGASVGLSSAESVYCTDRLSACLRVRSTTAKTETSKPFSARLLRPFQKRLRPKVWCPALGIKLG